MTEFNATLAKVVYVLTKYGVGPYNPATRRLECNACKFFYTKAQEQIKDWTTHYMAAKDSKAYPKQVI